uniref:Uncharacterized protein MANES_15G149200 n=1 Tax=Rhizophora mucronata TaxID=61149 RepID=A0A2P2KLV3_RHIMU
MAATATASSTAPRYAPDDPTLPKPWRGLVDGRTGYLYFWNPETNVTQYERPTSSAPLPKPSSAPISSSVQFQQSSRHGYNPVKEDGRYGRGNNGESKPDSVTRGFQGIRGGSIQSQNVPNGTASGSSGPYAKESGLSVEAYRRRHEITVTGNEVPLPLTSFEATGFPAEILREVQNLAHSFCHYAMLLAWSSSKLANYELDVLWAKFCDCWRSRIEFQTR